VETNLISGMRVLATLAIMVLAGCSNASQAIPPGGTMLPGALDLSRNAKLTAHYVKIPASDSIQDDLISTFPVGIYKPKHGSFSIPSRPKKCGYSDTGACNFYDGFSGSGAKITVTTSIAKPTAAYTLMNAYSPQPSQQLATIEFVGSRGAKVTFPLIGGKDIRDFYDGSFADTLTNGVPGVVARNVFHCVDPKTCLGGGGTGNVHTGEQGKYRIDEQQYTLKALKGQTLKKVIVTDTYSGSTPILLGLTIESR
jgi:hypothetical protein